MAKGIRDIIEVFKTMPAGKRISLLITFVIFVGGFAVFFTYVNRPNSNYEVLFSGLDLADTAKITEKLMEKRVKYELKDSGHTIMVERDMINNLRLDIAAEGIISKRGTAGFEIFSMRPELEQKYQQALQSELERTIRKLYTFDDVRVHIGSVVEATSEQEGKPVTASVAVKLHPGGKLDTKQVQTIFNIVLCAVKGLKPENLSIVDMEKGILKKGND